MYPFNTQPKKMFQGGFTLVEVLVSLIIFSVVVVMAIGAVFSLVNAGEKARSLNSVMGNLNIALETMADTVRFGNSYSTVSGAQASCVDVSTGQTVGSQSLYFVPAPNSVITSSETGGLNVQSIVYKLVNNQIVEQLNYYNNASPAATVPITAAEVHVTNLTFWGHNCNALPPQKAYVLMSVSGYAETRQSDKVSFNIQTTMTAR